MNKLQCVKAALVASKSKDSQKLLARFTAISGRDTKGELGSTGFLGLSCVWQTLCDFVGCILHFSGGFPSPHVLLCFLGRFVLYLGPSYIRKPFLL